MNTGSEYRKFIRKKESDYYSILLTKFKLQRIVLSG